MGPDICIKHAVITDGDKSAIVYSSRYEKRLAQVTLLIYSFLYTILKALSTLGSRPLHTTLANNDLGRLLTAL